MGQPCAGAALPGRERDREERLEEHERRRVRGGHRGHGIPERRAAEGRGLGGERGVEGGREIGEGGLRRQPSSSSDTRSSCRTARVRGAYTVVFEGPDAAVL